MKNQKKDKNTPSQKSKAKSEKTMREIEAALTLRDAYRPLGHLRKSLSEEDSLSIA
ncbi:MAG: hypothetical protein NXH75_01610 [Halobacteriovoraceae bacterium]|nr:hypothetical protein [Halobacteriovoraceae bacterium]